MSKIIGNPITLGGGGYEIPEYAVSFLGMGDFTVKSNTGSKTWDGNMEYSTNGKAWQTWSGAQISSKKGFIALRGSGNTYLTRRSVTDSFIFADVPFYCSGNIETLLDWQTVAAGNHPIMGNSAFAGLFSWSKIVSPPRLPATGLSYNCYNSMFSGCSYLAAAPELPATTMAQQCYAYMFNSCYALNAPPSLPATSLADGCYESMFQNCRVFINLASYSLPALSIPASAYANMFAGCSSMIVPPPLPATTLGDSCYYTMFKGCRSLTRLPQLPATSIPTMAYEEMFANCSSLKLSATSTGIYTKSYRIPTNGTGTEDDALTDMFANTGGTFTGTPTINTTYYTNTNPVS